MSQSAEQQMMGVLRLSTSATAPIESAAAYLEQIRVLKQHIQQMRQEALERNRTINKLNNQIQRYYDVIGANREDY